MKITKLGHCCLLIETNGKRVLTDPGAFSKTQDTLSGIDMVVISHEHADHLHIDSLKTIISNNKEVKVISNAAVGRILDAEGIPYLMIDGRESKFIDGVHIEAFDHKHEEIYEDFGQVQNTGYFIGEELFYPGDSFAEPGKEVRVLALPVAGPWCKIGDAIRYALRVKPQKAFPVHDAIIAKEFVGFLHSTPERILKQNHIEFVPMVDNDTKDF